MAEPIMRKKPTVPKEYALDAAEVQKDYSLTKQQMNSVVENAVKMKIQPSRIVETLKANLTSKNGVSMITDHTIWELNNRLTDDKLLLKSAQEEAKEKKGVMTKVADKLLGPDRTEKRIADIQNEVKRKENIIKILETFRNDDGLLEQIGKKK
jgi:uncharacterized membrane-anchored protein YjiN (DUF445 family)